MTILLSGLIGALIATILSVIYHYISEQSRLRSEAALEAIGYFDDIYKSLQMLNVDKEAAYKGKKRGLTDEEYRITSRTLKDLLNTSRVGAKIAIVYGEGNITGAFNFLQASCLCASELLWGAKEQDWEEKHNQITILFHEKIDPVRKIFERHLIEQTRSHQIIKGLIYRCTGRVFKKQKQIEPTSR